MTKQDSAASWVQSGVAVPGNVHVIQPIYDVVSESQEQPLRVTTCPDSATVIQYDPGRANSKTPITMSQNVAGLTSAQSQPTGMQYPVGMAGLQIASGVIQYSPGAVDGQVLPGDQQNPLNTVPGPAQTSNYSQWNMSFVSFPAFDPQKFINEEVRTLGAIQIIIGLFHIFSAVNPMLYHYFSVTRISGYLIWGGISFVVSGTLSVWAEKDSSNCMVNASIGMNVVSSILSLLGIVILIVDIALPRNSQYSKGVSGSLFPFALLEFILTCVVSHFGCQAVCWTHFENMTGIPVIFNNNMTNGPSNTTVSPANATANLASPTFPSDVPPAPSRQDVTDFSQR